MKRPYLIGYTVGSEPSTTTALEGIESGQQSSCGLDYSLEEEKSGWDLRGQSKGGDFGRKQKRGCAL